MGNRNFKHCIKAFLHFEQGSTQIPGNVNRKAEMDNINPLEEIYNYLKGPAIKVPFNHFV